MVLLCCCRCAHVLLLPFACIMQEVLDAKQLTAATLRVMILDRENLEAIFQVMSVVTMSYAQVCEGKRITMQQQQ